MVDFNNLSFETIGPSPGQADLWSITSAVADFEVAAFDSGEKGVEDFETGWDSNEAFLFFFDDIDVTAAIFDPTDVPQEVEDLERAWGPFDGDRATLFSSKVEPFALVDGQTFVVSVDGGGDQTATFNTGDFADIANATAIEVAAVINTDTAGMTAIAFNGLVKVLSDTVAGASSLQVRPASTALDLGYPLGVVKPPDFAQKVDPTANHLPNQNFLFAIGASTAAAFDSGTPQAFEDFEEEWSSNENFLFGGGPGGDFEAVLTAASFDTAPQDFEDFEEGWLDNENFLVGSAGGFQTGDFEATLTAAMFATPGPADAFEDFGAYTDADEAAQISLLVVGDDYDTVINGEIFRYTVLGGDTAFDVTTAIAALVTNSSHPVTAVGGTPVSGQVLFLADGVEGFELDIKATNPVNYQISTQTEEATRWLMPMKTI